MIGQIIPLMVVWRCSVPRVHRWISTYPLRRNGKPMTGKQKLYFLRSLSTTLIRHRLLYRPQLAVDGNMKLVHLIMRRPEDDVSLSDGELFIVRQAPYAEHLVHAPQRQPVSTHKSMVNLWAHKCQEIEMQ
jgi:hypothetical protein